MAVVRVVTARHARQPISEQRSCSCELAYVLGNDSINGLDFHIGLGLRLLIHMTIVSLVSWSLSTRLLCRQLR